MGLLGGKLALVTSTSYRPGDDGPMAGPEESGRRIEGGFLAGKQAEHRGAAASHRRISRTGRLQAADQFCNLRMTTGNGRLEVVRALRRRWPVEIPPGEGLLRADAERRQHQHHP